MEYNLGKIEKHVKNLSNSIKDLEKMCETSAADLSMVDREITDIYHYIEFANLDACRGFKAYQMLKDRLIRRREIKNCQEVLQAIRANGFSKANANSIMKKIDARKEHKYKPRVLNELFGKGE